MLELRAWQLARMKVGKRIRKQVWDDMEVKGMSIKVVPILIMKVLAIIVTVFHCGCGSFGGQYNNLHILPDLKYLSTLPMC